MRQVCRTFGSNNRARTLINGVVLVFALTILGRLASPEELFQQLQWYGTIAIATSLALALFVVAQFALAPARLHRQMVERCEALRRELAESERKWDPQLDIAEGTGQPFEQRQGIRLVDGVSTERLYRVGVRNISRKTIAHVALDLERIMPPAGPPGVVRLHVMHDNPPGPPGAPAYMREFQLDPDETRYVDVVIKVDGETRPIVIFHIEPFVDSQLPPGRYELTLYAHGEGAPPCRRAFIVRVGQSGILRFGAA